MKNPGLKFAALLCAVSLWFFVVSGRTHRVERRIAVRLANLAPELALASALPDSLTVWLEGSGRELMRLGDTSVTLEINMIGATLGNQRISLSPDLVKLPINSEVRAVSLQGPVQLDMELDARLRRKVPVRNRAVLSAAEGFLVVQSPIPDPAEVEVSGARRNITRVFEANTLPIHLDNLTGDTAVLLPLDPSTLPPQIRLETPAVTLALSVQPLERRIFASVPIQLVGGPGRREWILEPATATVEVTGGREIVRALRVSEMDLFIEYSRFAIEGAEALAPTVSIHRPLQSWQIKPEVFRLVAAPAAAELDSTSEPEVF